MHWRRIHIDCRMPDKIEYVEEIPKPRRNLKKNPVRNIGENRSQRPIDPSVLDSLG